MFEDCLRDGARAAFELVEAVLLMLDWLSLLVDVSVLALDRFLVMDSMIV